MSSYSPAVKKLLKKLVKNFYERQATGDTHPFACAAFVGKALTPPEVSLVHQAAMDLIKRRGEGAVGGARKPD